MNMIHNFDTMRDLVEKLNHYTKLYDEGNPAITDKEWDDMYFQLQELENEFGVILSNSPTKKIDYQVINQLNKVEHNHLMLSLDKTKNEEDVVSFLKGQDGIAMAKMDGLTCSLRYENGELVSAETRGNGSIGEDITHNIKFVKSVPLTIPVKNEVVIDGEVICTYSDFEEFSSEYANPRNFAAGSIRLLDSAECAKRKLTFVAWDCIKGLDNCKWLSDKLIQLDKWGFNFVPFTSIPKNMVNLDSVKLCIMNLQRWTGDDGLPIDGIVFKYDDCAYYQSLGYTGHHFRGGLAFKFYDEEYETHLRNIEWSMGKTGQITPVAIFDPVDDGESTITRASLHNLNIMNQILGHPYCNQSIKVVKQNQIIPQITWGEKKDEDMLWYFDPPITCPVCGAATTIKDDFLYCTNPDCEGKFINRLDHFVGKKGLDIKGLSKATLGKLIEWGWINKLHDLFTLETYAIEWKEKSGFGVKSVDNILSAIQNARDCELWQFISGLSIPLIGSTYAKEMCKHEFDWHNIREDIEGNFDFTKWDGFGYEMNKSLHSFDYTEADELVENVLYLKNSLFNQKKEKTELTGKVFCITGKLNTFKNRDEAKEKIEAAGGKVVDSVSKKTNYLVNNDINSTSSKNQKAKSLNIPIISEEQLIEMF